MEGVDATTYYDGFNDGLGRYGNYVFYAVRVSEMTGFDDYYGNVYLAKNSVYYLVEIYDSAIYYRYASDYKDFNNYSLSTRDIIDSKSLIKKYIYYQENGDLMKKEVYL